MKSREPPRLPKTRQTPPPGSPSVHDCPTTGVIRLRPGADHLQLHARLPLLTQGAKTVQGSRWSRVGYRWESPVADIDSPTAMPKGRRPYVQACVMGLMGLRLRSSSSKSSWSREGFGVV